MSKKVVVVLPTYNERANIETITNDVLSQEKNLSGYSIEVLIVDSHSPDGTGEVAKKLANQNPKIHFIEVGRGLGIGLIEGHKYSLEHLHPDIMAQLDADGQVEPDVLVRLVGAVEEGYDLGIGSRFVPGGKNQLSFSRRIFSSGASFICRLIMGPWGVKEFTNSSRAFTPKLFKKINLDRLPWREKTFIIQPAFLHEAIMEGAKYKEVPLVFKNRAEGYSKNKVVNYVYDVLTYALDARLHQWGINIPVFKLTRRAKTLIKFGVVGLTGTLIDFGIYHTLVTKVGLKPATSKGISTEIAIINNFILNNAWTFKYRRTQTSPIQKFGLFNLISLGGLAIGVVIIKFLNTVYGDGYAHILGLNIAYFDLFFVITIPPVLIWNFTVNHLITWRHKT